MRLTAAAFAACLPLALMAQDGPQVSLAESADLGPYIVGPGGKPLYMFRTGQRAGDDLPAIESCNERCRTDWPLVEVPEEIEVGEGVEADLAATLTWEDREVLVYGERTMFTFVRDAPGEEPVGHGVHTYGGWWFLVQPNGEPVDAPGLEFVED